MSDNNLVDNILDFLGFVLIMGICLSVAFSVVLPIFSEATFSEYEETEDKTAPRLEGEGNHSDYDGKMSKLEVVLMTQIQDYDLPDPKVFKVDTTKVEVESFYQATRSLVGEDVFEKLSKTPSGGKEYRYDWAYNYGSPPSIDNIDTGNLLVNPYAEGSIKEDGVPSGWSTYATDRNNVSFRLSQQGNGTVISGNRSFWIRTTGNKEGNRGTEYTGYYYQNVDVEPGKKYRFSANIMCHRCEGYIEAEVFNNTGGSYVYKSDRTINTSVSERKVVEFTAPIDATRVQVKLVKDISRGHTPENAAHDSFYADDISLQILDGEDPHYYLRRH